MKIVKVNKLYLDEYDLAPKVTIADMLNSGRPVCGTDFISDAWQHMITADLVFFETTDGKERVIKNRNGMVR